MVRGVFLFKGVVSCLWGYYMTILNMLIFGFLIYE